jgi:hypothetical protein
MRAQIQTVVHSEASRPHAGVLLLSLLTWFGLCGALFLGFGWLAWTLGDPVRVPNWVVQLARLDGNAAAPRVFLEVLFLLAWMAVVGTVSVLAAMTVGRLNIVLGQALGLTRKRADYNSDAALLSLVPLIVVCGLTLLILPAQAPRPSSGLSMGEVARYVTFPEFMQLMLAGTLAMVAIGSILVSIFAAYGLGSWIQRKDDPGTGFLLLGIIGGVIVAIGVGLGGGEVFNWLERRMPALEEVWLVLGAYALLSAPFLLRASLKPANAGRIKRKHRAVAA